MIGVSMRVTPNEIGLKPKSSSLHIIPMYFHEILSTKARPLSLLHSLMINEHHFSVKAITLP